MVKIKFKEIKVIEEEDEELNDDLIIKNKGAIILDLESLIIEANQNKDIGIGPYTMWDHLEPYIEEIYRYAMSLKEEYENVE